MSVAAGALIKNAVDMLESLREGIAIVRIAADDGVSVSAGGASRAFC